MKFWQILAIGGRICYHTIQKERQVFPFLRTELPKQSTPRKGTNTKRSFCSSFQFAETIYTPQGDEYTRSISAAVPMVETIYTPQGDEYPMCLRVVAVPLRNNLHPARGRIPDRTELNHHHRRNNLHPARGRILEMLERRVFAVKKQSTPRKGTNTAVGFHSQKLLRETIYTPQGDECS